MSFASEVLLRVFHAGSAFDFSRAGVSSFSYFGGPFAVRLKGMAPGPLPLHRMATIGASDIWRIAPDCVFDLPLIYGMCFDGCQLDYAFAYESEIEISRISPPTSREDWPYRDYPRILPYAPLAVSEPKAMSWQEFAPGLAANLTEPGPTRLIAMISPPMTLGTSLWGPMGDAEGVSVVFDCDLEQRTVRAFNACS